MIGVNHGRCFAGNTALLACCDVIIVTEDSTIAMGGPAMIEGGGLGIYTPEEVGPMSFQVPNGVVDILVENEAEVVRVANIYPTSKVRLVLGKLPISGSCVILFRRIGCAFTTCEKLYRRLLIGSLYWRFELVLASV